MKLPENKVIDNSASGRPSRPKLAHRKISDNRSSILPISIQSVYSFATHRFP